jgi:hypothetical protein
MPKRKDEIKELTAKLSRVRGRLAGVQPILITIQDSGEIDPNSLEAIGGLVKYCGNSIGYITARLNKLAGA